MTDVWERAKFVQHRVRNIVRRGWLLKTYNDGKLLKGRIKTAEKYDENDDLDILHPVGMVAHVAPSNKTEIFTLDVNGDPSRRVIWQVIGDREEHPAPDENEMFFYAPGDKKLHIRIKKERNQQERSNDNSGRTKESGRETGVHLEGKDQPVSSKTKDANATSADKGIGYQTQEGNFTVRAGQNTQFEASKHIRKGETHREGQMFVEGMVHATDVFAGGGTEIQLGETARDVGGIIENGKKTWEALGKPGGKSLSQTFDLVQALYGLFNNFQKLFSDSQDSQQTTNDQVKQDVDDLKKRVTEIERILKEHGWMT